MSFKNLQIGNSNRCLKYNELSFIGKIETKREFCVQNEFAAATRVRHRVDKKQQSLLNIRTTGFSSESQAAEFSSCTTQQN